MEMEMDDGHDQPERSKLALVDIEAHLKAAGLTLPDDPASRGFTDAVEALRPQFQDRSTFNHMLCDELARRGIQPNSNNVLKFGRWGSSAAVAADVRSWYASLAKRMQAQHANIPDVARQRANALLEQLWAIALDAVGEPLTQHTRKLEAALDDERIRSAAAIAQLTTSLASCQDELDRANEAGNHLQQQVDQMAHDKAATAASFEVERSALLARQVQAEEETKRLATLLAEEKRSRAAEVDSLQASSRQALEQARTDLNETVRAQDAQRKEWMRMLDAAREDAKAAAQRAERAEVRERAESNGLREINSALQIECARLESRLQAASAKLEDMETPRQKARLRRQKRG